MKISISEAAQQDLIEIQVYAVLDCRRDPAWIRDRLT